MGIEEVFMLCTVGPAQHDEVMHTIRLIGEQVIPRKQPDPGKVQKAS